MWILRIVGFCWMFVPLLMLFSGTMTSDMGGYGAFSFILGLLLVIASTDKKHNKENKKTDYTIYEEYQRDYSSNSIQEFIEIKQNEIIKKSKALSSKKQNIISDVEPETDNEVPENPPETGEIKDIKLVNYQSNFVENSNNYPVIKIPTLGTIVRTHYIIDNRLRGVLEDSFQEQLLNYFSNNFEIRGDVRINTSESTRPYLPDIALISKTEKNIRIDIEIDEPYSGISKIPTHCIGDDLARDYFFINRGWIVVRFTEHQIKHQKNECLFLIASLIKSIDVNFEIPKPLQNFELPTSEEFWDTLQAKKWMLEDFRENYLGITFTEAAVRIPSTPDFTLQDEIEEKKVSNTFIEPFENNDISDSRDKMLHFYPKSHTYMVNNVTFQSVSTIISRFFSEFDADQAIDNMMNGMNWNSEHRYWGMTPYEIKELWRLNGEEAAQLGENLHKQIELYFNGQLYDTGDAFNLFEEFISDHQEIEPLRTEWRIFDEDYNIAGTVDLVSQDGEFFDLYDWKRSKNILNPNTLEPIEENRWRVGYGNLNHIDDTDFNKYSLQLSLYRYILENKYNLNIRDMYIVVMHPKYDTYHKIPINYYREEVEIILNSI